MALDTSMSNPMKTRGLTTSYDKSAVGGANVGPLLYADGLSPERVIIVGHENSSNSLTFVTGGDKKTAKMALWEPVNYANEEEEEKDILLMAEYCIPTPEDLDPVLNPVPDTILNYRRKMAGNKQRTLNSDLDDGASYIVSGRGRGIRDRVIRPGEPIEIHPSDEVELKKQIREVAGMGYSNEFIEQHVNANSYNPEERSSDDNGSRFKFVVSPSSSSSSIASNSKSSAENSPKKKIFVKKHM